MNSWFSVQATSRREDTLEQIVDLMKHPAFDLRNPNKVRALLVTFAVNNPARFHDSDGRAYTFFTDRLLEVDALNSHMGAAMVRPLMSWRRHEAGRAGRLKEQLQRVVAADKLSPNAFEIASKSLAEE
jgi:aminopeptidase N